MTCWLKDINTYLSIKICLFLLWGTATTLQACTSLSLCHMLHVLKHYSELLCQEKHLLFMIFLRYSVVCRLGAHGNTWRNLFTKIIPLWLGNILSHFRSRTLVHLNEKWMVCSDWCLISYLNTNKIHDISWNIYCHGIYFLLIDWFGFFPFFTEWTLHLGGGSRRPIGTKLMLMVCVADIEVKQGDTHVCLRSCQNNQHRGRAMAA